MIPPLAAVVLALALSHAVPDRAPHAVTETRQKAIRGLASYMPERYGSRYLALPRGPGVRVRICGKGGCLTMTSTDAGPDRAMQRAGRVADIGVLAWERICGVPRSRGLCKVTIRGA